jgi:hypothetical protein
MGCYKGVHGDGPEWIYNNIRLYGLCCISRLAALRPEQDIHNSKQPTDKCILSSSCALKRILEAVFVTEGEIASLYEIQVRCMFKKGVYRSVGW